MIENERNERESTFKLARSLVSVFRTDQRTDFHTFLYYFTYPINILIFRPTLRTYLPIVLILFISRSNWNDTFSNKSYFSSLTTSATEHLQNWLHWTIVYIFILFICSLAFSFFKIVKKITLSIICNITFIPWLVGEDYKMLLQAIYWTINE